MRTLILTLAFCLIASVGYCADGDIAQTEVKPDVAKWALDTFLCHTFTQQCTVTYRKVDADGNIIGIIEIIFANIDDYAGTLEDETDTSFTDLIVAINNGSNIKTTLKNAVKVKLGIN